MLHRLTNVLWEPWEYRRNLGTVGDYNSFAFDAVVALSLLMENQRRKYDSKTHMNFREEVVLIKPPVLLKQSSVISLIAPPDAYYGIRLGCSVCIFNVGSVLLLCLLPGMLRW